MPYSSDRALHRNPLSGDAMPIVSRENAERFAEEWIAAWNARDLDAVLEHYADDFEFSSPYIAVIAGEASCKMAGKTAIRAYWAKALERIPELRFELRDVLAGVGGVTLYYRGHRGAVAETFL
jgi:ketosteroid isomerase-like protein